MNKHLLFSAFALMCCLTACEKNDDPTPAPQPSRIGGTLVMATTVLNPSGTANRHRSRFYRQQPRDTRRIWQSFHCARQECLRLPRLHGSVKSSVTALCHRCQPSARESRRNDVAGRFCSFAGRRSKRSHSLCFMPELRKSARLRL